MAQPTNQDFLADQLRQKYALDSPKGHIPGGILLFVVLSSMSANPVVPVAAAGLVAWDAWRRLKRNHKIIQQSHIDPKVLFDGLNKKEKEVVTQFSSVFPMIAPAGTTVADLKAAEAKKPEPPTAKKGANPSNSQTNQTSSTTKHQTPTSGGNKKDGGLPKPFVEYLSGMIHILVAATTGAGKTHLLKALGTKVSNRGDMLLIADPKGSQWGDLSPAVVSTIEPRNYLKVLAKMANEFKQRQYKLSEGVPVGQHLWVIFDEWVLAKSRLKSLSVPPSKDEPAEVSLDEIENLLLDVIVGGRELNMHLVIITQSHQLQDLSLAKGKNTFSSGVRDNLCTVGLGCKVTQDAEGEELKGNAKCIDAMLSDRNLIAEKSIRDSAIARHEKIRANKAANRTFCIYSSELYVGEPPAIEIPKLKQIQPLIQKVA